MPTFGAAVTDWVMIKKQVKRALLASGILRLAGRLQGKGAAILMYHSVLDDPSRVADSLGGMIHPRAVFEGQMELIAREFNPVTLDQVARFVRAEQDLPERPVVVTFDDGYVDNYAMAMPILDRAGVPATFYVTVDCVQNRRLPWPSRLRFSFRTTSKKTWTDAAGKVWNLVSQHERDLAYLVVCDQVASLAGEAQESRVRQIESDVDARLPNDAGRLMMTWDQIQTLAQHEHIVGSHTMTHPNMAHVSIEEARREFVESKQQMEAHIKAKVSHFSYPCPALSPNWTEQTAEECRRAGYETAVTTSSGLARKGANLLALKRVRPTKTVDGLRWNLETAFAGRAV
jgi:peptidoglycan/xylan/chitin deacetylase (PgdA/CDA1 family)